MGKTLTSIDDVLRTAVRRSVEKVVLMDYVAPVVENILRKHIEKDVYKAYAPRVYKRRDSLTSTVTSGMISSNELLVTATSQPNKPASGWVSSGDGAFLYMIEKGDLGWWRKGFSRPAISNAQREVDHSSAVKQAKKAGLKHVFGN